MSNVYLDPLLDLARIRKGLGGETKEGFKRELDDFLGRSPKTWKPRYKIPKHEPFFPMETLEALRHWSEGYSSPSVAEEIEMIKDFQSSKKGSKEHAVAFERILKSYIRFAIARAVYHANFGSTPEELIQESVFGIYRAAEKVDLDRGNRFLTYASNWIDQSISRHLAETLRLVRLPIHAHEVAKKYKSLRRKEYLLALPPAPMWRIALEFEIEQDRLEKIVFADDLTISMESVREKLQDAWSDHESFLTEIQNREMSKDIEIALSLLTPRESAVIRARYGLGSQDKMTLDQVGKQLGITREAVRQIEFRAFESLIRTPMASRLLSHLDIFPDDTTQDQYDNSEGSWFLGEVDPRPRRGRKKKSDSSAAKASRKPNKKDADSAANTPKAQSVFASKKSKKPITEEQWKELLERLQVALVMAGPNVTPAERTAAEWLKALSLKHWEHISLEVTEGNSFYFYVKSLKLLVGEPFRGA